MMVDTLGSSRDLMEGSDAMVRESNMMSVTSPSSSDADDTTESPDSHDSTEPMRTSRPIRNSRPSSLLEDMITDSDEEDSSVTVRTSSSARPRMSLLSQLGSSSDDVISKKTSHRRHYDDDSYMPPAKRPQSEPPSNLSSTASTRSFDWSSGSNMDATSPLTMHNMIHGTPMADPRFSPQGYAPHIFAFPFTNFGPAAVPQFLPHQMSLAHEQAQKLVENQDLMSSGFSSAAWSDRSAQNSRRSISSASSSSTTSLAASSSTLPDLASPKSHLQSPHPSHHQVSLNHTSLNHASNHTPLHNVVPALSHLRAVSPKSGLIPPGQVFRTYLS